MIHQLLTDDADLIVQAMTSNMNVEGFTEVSEELFDKASGLVGRARLVGDQVIEIPSDPPSLPAPTTRRYDVFERCTTDEASLISLAISNSDVRTMELIGATMRFVHGSEVYLALRTIIVDTLGAERADEILAPSDD
ncbi:hypothetical protein DYI37_03895 [Fulvimarina endophytica]|uniref:Uncharacterized protein n=2 Tax=Fulvimarina endophytica TaxID=2293836 RepID=A0A371X715_9HYPH|nr:hypothetical protein DYI37_03895 [Fulvimarina endophytica]